MFDLKLLKVFAEVVRCRYVSGAAAKLKMTPSAVSQSIAALEEELGQTLFNRENRPMTLTAAGRILSIEGEKLLLQARQTEDRLKGRADYFPLLRLGLGETVCQTMGPWLIQELERYCGTLSVHSQFTRPLIQRMEGDEFDLLVAPYSLLNEKDGLRQALFTEDYLLVMHQGLEPPQTMDEFRTLAEEAHYVCYNADSSDRLEAERMLRSWEIEPFKKIEAATSYMLIGLVALKRGWTIVPALNFWCGRQFAEQCCFAKLPSESVATRTMWVSGRHGHREEIRVLSRLFNTSVKEKMLGELEALNPELLKYVHMENADSM